MHRAGEGAGSERSTGAEAVEEGRIGAEGTSDGRIRCRALIDRGIQLDIDDPLLGGLGAGQVRATRRHIIVAGGGNGISILHGDR